MSHLNVEEKLKLTSLIRSENERNRMQMNRIRELVYGEKTNPNFPLIAAEEPEKNNEKHSLLPVSLKFRFAISIVIYIMIIIMKYDNLSFGDLSYERLISSLKNNPIDFEKYISYTDEVDYYKNFFAHRLMQ